LTIMAGYAFSGAADLTESLAHFGWETAGLLSLTVATLAASILSAVACLTSRLKAGEDPTARTLAEESTCEDLERPLPAEISWFFGHLASLPPERVTRQLPQLSEVQAGIAIACSAALLSQNVLRKHIWAARASLAAGWTLVCLLLTAVSYVIRVQS